MIGGAQWLAITVGDFFGTLPWQGTTQSAIATERPSPVDYRLLSVRDFFANMAWDGYAFEAEFSAHSVQELSYVLSVSQFFNCFLWQGRPQIGVVPILNTRQTPPPDLSLNDLSDLF